MTHRDLLGYVVVTYTFYHHCTNIEVPPAEHYENRQTAQEFRPSKNGRAALMGRRFFNLRRAGVSDPGYSLSRSSITFSMPLTTSVKRS